MIRWLFLLAVTGLVVYITLPYLSRLWNWFMGLFGKPYEEANTSPENKKEKQ